MKNVILVLLLLSGLTAAGQSQTRRVLFLGNSYTAVNDLPKIVAALAANTGDVMVYDSHLTGGYTLEDHAASLVTQNKILSANWDYIILQEQSQRPTFINPGRFMDGFNSLKNFIKQNKPCAQITSFMTWGYKNGDAQNCPINPNVCTYTGMQTLLTERYMNMSQLFESEVTPVGVVWKYIKENYPAINLYQPDGSHPSIAGSYLAACCFYTSLFRKNPALITNNYGVDAATAALIRNATKSLVYDQLLNWYIGKYVPASNFNYTIGNGANEVVLNNTLTFSDALLWNFGDGATATLPNPTHSYAADGSYTIKLTSYKCYLGQQLTSVFERNVNFCAHTNTIYPNLLLCPQETGTLWTQPADGYQWCNASGTPIAGATQQSLQVNAGLFCSVLTTINGCTERSVPMLVDGYLNNPDCTVSGIDNIKPAESLIFPNPAQNILNIQTQKTVTTTAIYELSGKEIKVNKVSTQAYDIAHLAPGMYILKVGLGNGKSLTTKFIKQ